VGVFFIDTDNGQIATSRQLVEAGVVDEGAVPARPWHRIQGPSDASTLWYAVLRKKVARKADRDSRYVYIGALAIRHQPHHASLIAAGWEEVPVNELGVTDERIGGVEPASGGQAM
jgi:hypothetical protein